VLERIVCIDGVGVIKRGAPKAVDMAKVCLIYADNARGKSTLSSLLLACSSSDALDVIQRKTIGAGPKQNVHFRFKSSADAGVGSSTFDGAAWAGVQPNLHVVNQAFVERNVYASAGVLPEQREALLSLALGDAAVSQRAEFEAQAAVQRDCAGKVSAAEGALQGYRGSQTVDQFIALQPLADVDAQITATEKAIGAARAADQVAKRPEFKPILVPSFGFDGLPQVLASSFESLSAKAQETAKRHFSRHKGAATERWVAEGLNHGPDEDCPFCGQPTRDLELLKAYKAYFDGSYSEHLKRIAALREDIGSRLGDRQFVSWHVNQEFNLGLTSVWAESIDELAIPSLEYEKAMETLGRVRSRLFEVAGEKERNPLAALEPGAFTEASRELQTLTGQAQTYNKQIETLNAKIAVFKAKHAAGDVATLSISRDELVVRKNRYDPKVVALVEAVSQARASYKAAESAKDVARAEVDKLMVETLKQFQGSINEWLVKFAAPFQIDELAPTYRGGGLRSEYVLKVRGATVTVGPGGGGQLSFHSALSEGDKRTLAFAFFLARLFADPTRVTASVVLDDVFTSLDKHRRHNTIEAVLRMANECAQVVALAHDAHFLRELKKRVAKKKLGTTLELALHRDADDYSYIDAFDLDDYCSSDYYKHYLLVERFVAADNTVNLLEVAKALRLLVEGHLHRCFPKKFKEGQTVGEMLEQVKNAKAPDPLARLHPLHPELVSFNEFAAAFHHDTSGGFPRTEVNAAEVLSFARGALGFIHIRSFR
jgi:wobble nucleotide-excising tRNase